MGRACIWIVMFCLVVSLVSAVEEVQFQTAASGPSIDAIIAAINAMEAKLAKDINDYNDENFLTFDQRMSDLSQKMVSFVNGVQTKAIIGILGLNALVAGAVFYFMNKQTRKLSYDSYLLRTKQSEDDRKYMADAINALRTKLEYVEQEASKKFDLSVIPMDILDAEMRRRYDIQYAEEQQNFDQQVGNFVEQQQYGGVQDGWGRREFDGRSGYGQVATEEAQYATPSNAVAGEYASQAASAAVAPIHGGAQAQRRFSKARLI